MNENRKEESVTSGSTPMNFVQRTKKKMKETNRSIHDKSVQKHTSLKRNGVKMRNRPYGMTSDPKEKIMNLNELSSGDPRIRTPLDRSPSDV